MEKEILECFILALLSYKWQVFFSGIYVIVLGNYTHLNLNTVKTSKISAHCFSFGFDGDSE